MAIQYTPVTLEEIRSFILRAFRALRPTQAYARDGDICYDLHLSEGISVRVNTSVSRGREQAKGKGQDAIRVMLFNFSTGFPTRAGEDWPIVKRTQNWRDNLRERIEDEIETYHAREEHWESYVRL